MRFPTQICLRPGTSNAWSSSFQRTTEWVGTESPSFITRARKGFHKEPMSLLMPLPETWARLLKRTPVSHCSVCCPITCQNLTSFSLHNFLALRFFFFGWYCRCLVYVCEYLPAFLRSIRIIQVPIVMITHIDLTIYCCVGSYKYFVSILCNP